MKPRFFAHTMVPVGIEDFEEYLTSTYDWFYYMCDDPRLFWAGDRANHALNTFLASSEVTDEHKLCYNRHHAARFNTPTFVGKDGTYKPPFAVDETPADTTQKA